MKLKSLITFIRIVQIVVVLVVLVINLSWVNLRNSSQSGAKFTIERTSTFRAHGPKMILSSPEVRKTIFNAIPSNPKLDYENEALLAKYNEQELILEPHSFIPKFKTSNSYLYYLSAFLLLITIAFT